MNILSIPIPDVPQRIGDSFDRIVKSRLEKPLPVKLSVFSVQELNGVDPKLYPNCIVACSNGNSGVECLAYSNGFNWKILELGDNISL